MNKVLHDAFTKTNAISFSKWWWGSFGIVVAVLLFGKNFFGLTILESVIFGGILFLSFYILCFIVMCFKYGYKHAILKYRESIYGDAIIFLKEAFSHVHHLRKKKEFDDTAFKSVLAFMCNNLKDIFEKKTGGKCAVSIKGIKDIDSATMGVTADTELFNLCRDKVSHEKRNSTKYNEVKHQVFSNTCYNVIFDNLSRKRINRLYYVNNNIPSKRASENTKNPLVAQSDSYQNTSYDVYDALPYKSEIVVPIIPIINEESNFYNLLGFICVDCEKPTAFDDKYDLAILQGVADGIYDIFVLRIKSQITTKI